MATGACDGHIGLGAAHMHLDSARLQQPLPSRRAHAQQQLAEADNGAGHELSLAVNAIILGARDEMPRGDGWPAFNCR